MRDFLRKSNGFTLPETLVALSIFSVGIAILSQVFIDFFRLTQLNFDVSQTMNDVRVFQERFTKIMRFSVLDLADIGITGPIASTTSSVIVFQNPYLNKKITLEFIDNTIIETDVDLSSGSTTQSTSFGGTTRLTDAKFVIQNYGCGDDLNPRVTASLTLLPPQSLRANSPEPLYFQTTVSQRCVENFNSECQTIQPQCQPKPSKE